jgi:hypothetical protein
MWVFGQGIRILNLHSNEKGILEGSCSYIGILDMFHLKRTKYKSIYVDASDKCIKRSYDDKN